MGFNYLLLNLRIPWALFCSSTEAVSSVKGKDAWVYSYSTQELLVALFLLRACCGFLRWNTGRNVWRQRWEHRGSTSVIWRLNYQRRIKLQLMQLRRKRRHLPVHYERLRHWKILKWKSSKSSQKLSLLFVTSSLSIKELMVAISVLRQMELWWTAWYWVQRLLKGFSLVAPKGLPEFNICMCHV